MISRPIAVYVVLLSLCVFTGEEAKSQSEQTTTKWSQEPKGFKNLTFGSTKEELRRLVRFSSCVTDQKDPTLQTCYFQTKIGERPSRSSLAFLDDRLAAVMGNFPSKAFVEISDIFIERYGKPHETSEHPAQTRSGLTLSNSRMEWAGEEASIRLERYGGTLENGFYMISLKSFWIRFHETRNDATKKAAKEL